FVRQRRHKIRQRRQPHRQRRLRVLPRRRFHAACSNSRRKRSNDDSAASNSKCSFKPGLHRSSRLSQPAPPQRSGATTPVLAGPEKSTRSATASPPKPTPKAVFARDLHLKSLTNGR